MFSRLRESWCAQDGLAGAFTAAICLDESGPNRQSTAYTHPGPSGVHSITLFSASATRFDLTIASIKNTGPGWRGGV